jgi:hypothetical protein
MAADSVLARELAALREELSASLAQAPATDVPPRGAKPAEPAPAADQPGEESPIAEQLHDLVAAIKEFAEEAEQNLAEHPTATVVGALLLGIVIGRLLGRR